VGYGGGKGHRGHFSGTAPAASIAALRIAPARIAKGPGGPESCSENRIGRTAWSAEAAEPVCVEPSRHAPTHRVTAML